MLIKQNINVETNATKRRVCNDSFYREPLIAEKGKVILYRTWSWSCAPSKWLGCDGFTRYSDRVSVHLPVLEEVPIVRLE